MNNVTSIQTRRSVLMIIKELTGFKPVIWMTKLQEAPVMQDQLTWYKNYLQFHKT